MIKLIDLEALKTYDQEIKKYVGKFNSGSGEGSFGSQTAQALGDYSVALGENSKAISDNSVTIGKNSFAGSKGFYFENIEFIVNGEGVTTGAKLAITDSTTNSAPSTGVYTGSKNIDLSGLETGDIVSIMNLVKYYDCATIIDITNNVITVEGVDGIFPFSKININEEEKSIDDYSIFVTEKPEVGIADIGINAISEGLNSRAYGNGAHAEGTDNIAVGHNSHVEGKENIAYHLAHAEGNENIAKGRYAHAEGKKTQSLAEATHTEGRQTIASAQAAHAEGYGSKAIGTHSHAEGGSTIAEGEKSHAEGHRSKSIGKGSHAEGHGTQAIGFYSHTEGNGSIANGVNAHAEGSTTQADGISAHAEGAATKALGDYSHSEGRGTIATGSDQHVQGKYNVEDTEDIYAHIVGNGTKEDRRSNAHTLDWDGNAWFAGDIYLGENNDKVATEKIIEKLIGAAPATLDTLNELAKALGNDPNFATTMANELAKKANKTELGTLQVGSGNYSLQAGTGTASGSYSMAVGRTTEASGPHSFAEGWNTDATGDSSHAEGINTVASGTYTHAEGNKTQATSEAAHAEGKETISEGQASHAEGFGTKAQKQAAHAEGKNTIAYGSASHAEGQDTHVRSSGAHVEGWGTYIPVGSSYQHVQGKYNVLDSNGKYAHIVGNGTSADDRSNAHTLDWDGNAWFAGDVTIGVNNEKLVTESRVQELASSINKIASTTELGSIIVGTGLAISENGVLSVTGEATETVSVADKAIADELGRNIVNTYPTVEQVNTKLNNYATQQYITELNLVNQATLANYSTTAQVEIMIQNYINDSILNGEW